MKYKECVGKCPYCDSDDIDYGVMTPQDDYLYYAASCNNCEEEFTEYYTIEYDNTGYEEE